MCEKKSKYMSVFLLIYCHTEEVEEYVFCVTCHLTKQVSHVTHNLHSNCHELDRAVSNRHSLCEIVCDDANLDVHCEAASANGAMLRARVARAALSV